jgi:hypothetical protein
MINTTPFSAAAEDTSVAVAVLVDEVSCDIAASVAAAR